jgi:tetratricopeptide (TPR) repeat protein
LLLSDNRIEQALAAFHTALLQSSHVIALTSYAFERLAFIASYEQRDFRQALVYLDKSIQTYPLSEDRAWLVQAYFLRGRILRDMHRLQEAVQTAEAALKLTTQRGLPRASLLEALFNAAEIFSRAEHQHERVIAVLEQYLSLSKRPPGVSVSWSRAYEMLADAYFSAGHYERAATSYLAALQYNPYHPWEYALYLRAARAYYQQGLYDQTQRIVQRAIQGAESEGQTIDFRAYDLLGSAYYALNKFPQSVEAFDKALALIPSNDASKPKIVQYRQYATEAQARDNGTTPS